MENNDWHAGFVSAMKLELLEDEDNLIFDEEHHIANRAQRIDLLIIKKIRDLEIGKSIGKAFGMFNILEYKGPGDNLTYEDFHKVMGYAHLYFSERRDSQSYGNNDYSVTLIQEAFPRKMFSLMERDGLMVKQTAKAVYEIGIGEIFRTQVIVTKDLPRDEYVWLKSLTQHGTKQNIEDIINETRRLGKRYKELTDSVMNTFAKGNTEVILQVEKEDKEMCEAIEEIFAEKHRRELEEKDIALAEKDTVIRAISREKDSAVKETEALKARVEELSKIVNEMMMAKA